MRDINPMSEENEKASRENAAEVKRLQAGSFHPLRHSDVLNQPGCRLREYIVKDARSRDSYVSQRLLYAVLLTYLKHAKGQDVIGWDDLSDELHAAICEAIGDDEFCKWNETTSNA